MRGCTKISPGCKNCYAERFAERFRGVAGHPFEQGFDLRLVPHALRLPSKKRAGRLLDGQEWNEMPACVQDVGSEHGPGPFEAVELS